MNYYYCGIEIELIENNYKIILKKEGKILEYSLNMRDYVSLYRSLSEITSDKSIFNPKFIRTSNIIQQFSDLGLLKLNTNVENLWKKLNKLYLNPYKILYTYALGKEKDCKALRDYFKPIEYALRSIKSVMEIELGKKIQTSINKVV